MELKPCPFCGGEAKTELDLYTMAENKLYLRATVFCGACGVGKTVKFNATLITFEKVLENLNAAVDMWNRRADDG